MFLENRFLTYLKCSAILISAISIVYLWICGVILYNICFNHLVIVFETSSPVNHVSEYFLSVGIDTVEISNGVDDLHLNSPRLAELTRLLGPGYVRLGGTMSDRLIFLKDNSVPRLEANKTSTINDKFLPWFGLSGSDFLKIYNFTNQSDFRMLFDVNVLTRNNGEWDSSNARELLEFASLNNMDLDWQLGNEPNSFKHVFNVDISPQQLSKDFEELKKLLKFFFPNSLLVGPDTTRPQSSRPSCLEYMKDFLSENPNTVDVIAWHQYYLNGRTATLHDFWDPETMNLLKRQIRNMRSAIKPYRYGRAMWLTETSSAYGGGAPGLSNTFAACPLWMDKLGVAASSGIQVVVRQSLIGANYSLIDHNLNPLPDWWLSYLFKNLVGEKVLKCSLRATKYQRMYCHCASKNSQVNKGLVMYGMNLANSTYDLSFSGMGLHDTMTIDEYVLTAPNGNRTSRHVLLNGNPLFYDGNTPVMRPNLLFNVSSFTMKPYSLGFWVFHDADVSFC